MEIDIHISLTTQAIMALSCYFTMLFLAVLLVWVLKLNIQSTCCFLTIILAGTVVVFTLGFAGLALHLRSDLESECALKHRDFTDMSTYASCQIQFLNPQFNSTIKLQIAAWMDEYLRKMQRTIPTHCPVRNIYTGPCGRVVGRGSMVAPNTTDFRMGVFKELSRLPLCGGGDSVGVCERKKWLLLNKAKQALGF